MEAIGVPVVCVFPKQSTQSPSNWSHEPTKLLDPNNFIEKMPS
jgi:hypothetical protein